MTDKPTTLADYESRYSIDMQPPADPAPEPVAPLDIPSPQDQLVDNWIAAITTISDQPHARRLYDQIMTMPGLTKANLDRVLAVMNGWPCCSCGAPADYSQNPHLCTDCAIETDAPEASTLTSPLSPAAELAAIRGRNTTIKRLESLASKGKWQAAGWFLLNPTSGRSGLSALMEVVRSNPNHINDLAYVVAVHNARQHRDVDQLLAYIADQSAELDRTRDHVAELEKALADIPSARVPARRSSKTPEVLAERALIRAWLDAVEQERPEYARTVWDALAAHRTVHGWDQITQSIIDRTLGMLERMELVQRYTVAGMVAPPSESSSSPATPSYTLTRTELRTLLDDALGLFVEFRDVHAQAEDLAALSAATEVLDGLDALPEIAAFEAERDS